MFIQFERLISRPASKEIAERLEELVNWARQLETKTCPNTGLAISKTILRHTLACYKPGGYFEGLTGHDIVNLYTTLNYASYVGAPVHGLSLLREYFEGGFIIQCPDGSVHCAEYPKRYRVCVATIAAAAIVQRGFDPMRVSFQKNALFEVYCGIRTLIPVCLSFGIDLASARSMEESDRVRYIRMATSREFVDSPQAIRHETIYAVAMSEPVPDELFYSMTSSSIDEDGATDASRYFEKWSKENPAPETSCPSLAGFQCPDCN